VHSIEVGNKNKLVVKKSKNENKKSTEAIAEDFEEEEKDNWKIRQE